MRTFGIHPTIIAGTNGPQKARGGPCESGSQGSSAGSNFQALTPASADQLERRFSDKSLQNISTSSSSAPTHPINHETNTTSDHRPSETDTLTLGTHTIPAPSDPSSPIIETTSIVLSPSCDCLSASQILEIESILSAAETHLAANNPSQSLEIISLLLTTKENAQRTREMSKIWAHSFSSSFTSRSSSAGVVSNKHMFVDVQHRLPLHLQEAAQVIYCKSLVQLGDARAFTACQMALKQFPKHYELLHLCGKMLVESGNPTEAVAYFSFALEAKPDHLPSWLARGLTYHTYLKDLAHAVSDFHTSIVLNPTYYKSFFYMGMVMSDLSRVALALEAYGRSIHLNPTFSESYFRRGVLHLQHHRLEEAIDDFSKVTELVPGSAEAHYNRALAQHLLKRNEAAIQSYLNCLKYQPSYVNALKNCAHAQSELGLYLEAFENYSTALTIPELDDNTKLDVLLARGQVCERNQDVEQALEDYSKAIELRPSLGRAFTYRGLLHLQRSARLDLALADFTQATLLEPENARAYNNLGTALLQLGQFSRALANFEKALEICPTLAKAVRNRAKALFLMRQHEPALLTLNSFTQQQPSAATQHDPEIYILRGLVHHAMGDTTKALKDLGRAPEPLRKRHTRLEQTELLTWLNLDFGTTSHENNDLLP